MPLKVFITGVSSGIGAVIAENLCASGHLVYGTVRKPEDGDRLSKAFPNHFRTILYDVSDVEGLTLIVQQVYQDDDRLDVLINNAGIAVSGPMELLSDEDIEKQIDVNLKAVIRITNAFIPALIKSGSGTVINISSVSARFTSPMLGAYSISKYALEAATDAYRRELLPWNVKVYSIQPGPIKTPIWEKAGQEMKDYRNTRYGPFIPSANMILKRSVKIAEPPEKIAKLAAKIIKNRPSKTKFLSTGNVFFYKVFLRILPASWMDQLILAQVKKHMK